MIQVSTLGSATGIPVQYISCNSYVRDTAAPICSVLWYNFKVCCVFVG